MAGGSDHGILIARVYALAILELAESQGDVDVVLRELEDLASRLESDATFGEFLSSPTVDAEARRQALERLFRGRYSDLFVDALQVLNRKGRLRLIPWIARCYREARDESQGRVEVRVSTPVRLTDDLREKLRAAAAQKTGKEPQLMEQVDESLIGGLVVQIGDHKFDDSVVRHLRKLGDALRNRASQEIFSGRTHAEGSPIAGT